MELELKCPQCREFHSDPILLQCSHSYCRDCAVQVLLKSQVVMSPPCSSNASDTMSLCVSDPDQESDKLSMVSESDSGVCIYGNSSRGSRPSSFLGSLPVHRLQPALATPSTSGHSLLCDLCQKPSFFADQRAILKQPTNEALQRLIARFKKTQLQPDQPDAASRQDCQWCEAPRSATASLYCKSCGFFYCTDCQPVIHPARGPLKEHVLVPADSISKRRDILSQHEPVVAHKCEMHEDEDISMYCTTCMSTVCCVCVQQGLHSNHNVQNLSTVVKTRKTEFSRNLQELSAKAKLATEQVNEINRLRQRVEDNSVEFEAHLNQQFEGIVENLEQKRLQLLEFVRLDKERKQRILRDQVARCASHLNKTTALVQFCIEILKEPDPVAYLHVDQALSNRATEADFLWKKNVSTKPEVSADFVLSLDLNPIHSAIGCMEFVQHQVPPRPYFVANNCSAENNSVMLSWDCLRNIQAVDGFVLELDSGKDDGKFKEVYRGPDTVCTIDGLHFNTLYNARLKAFNAAGDSAYSEPICLQTAPVAWFQLCKSMSQSGVVLSNQFSAVTGTSLDYSVVLGTVAFSRGVHYWEVTVDRLDVNTDIVLGVAQASVDKHSILGKDIYGWAMYMDSRRSWYFHNGEHHSRTEVCVAQGGVVGVRIDCDLGRLNFYLDDRAICTDGGLFAFQKMPRGLYYPAFSVNKGASITIHTGLSAPCIDPEFSNPDIL